MYPIIPFRDFTMYTPVVPAFYKNIYSPQEGIKKILLELDRLAAYANEIADAVNDDTRYTDLERRVSQLTEDVERIQDELDAIAAGGRYRNPVTGGYDYAYVVAKQVLDLLRTHCMTWRQLAETGMTWGAMHDAGHTYLELEMESNDIYGNGKPQYKLTAHDKIDVFSPGYFEDVRNIGH